MPERLDDQTKSALRSYLSDVRGLPNESAKTHRFATLIGELFPSSPVLREFAAGIEKAVRIDRSAAEHHRGRIDSYYGNAIVEFEKSLRATQAEALHQLREYVSAIWIAEPKPRRPLIAIASDGVTWQVYRPTLPADHKGKPYPDDIQLDKLRELVLSDKTLADFWLWLTSLLFRPQRTEPSGEQFKVDFGAASPAFREALEALRQGWEKLRGSSEPRLAFETWQKYLTVTYGRLTAGPENGGEALPSAALETLFLKHTYLASVARLLVWASLSKGHSTAPLREVASEVLSGRYFESQGLANLVESDFFQWIHRPKAEAVLAPVWERIIDQIQTYDLHHLGEDVLKGIYQELVDPQDRHDLGEYYTPDWLCERLVGELLPATGFVRVLDPSCGSGSFLRAAITHLLRSNPEGTDASRLSHVLDSVVGIDVHPLAVTISRATYLLALNSLAKAARRPIQIPVYLADSLFLPAEVRQLELGQSAGYEIRFGGDHRVAIPENVVKSADLFDGAIAACTEVAVDHAKSGKEDPRSLRAYLIKAVPDLQRQKNLDHVVGSLWNFTAELAELIRKGRNSIWAFIVRNAYRPAMLRERFDIIIGNPPWLSYRYIADPDYQAEVKQRAVQEYAIAPKSQKLMTQMELASVFLAHCIATFGSENARLGFVMPRSVLSADQHANLRTRAYKARFKLTGYWDLIDVAPLFRVPACVLFARKDYPGTPYEELPVIEWTGKLPGKDIPWSSAKEHLTEKPATGRLIFLGERSALSTDTGSSRPTKVSPYAGRFRQGATIVPRNFYFVRVKDLTGVPDPDRLYWAETDPEQAEDAKPPYKETMLRGQAQGRFIFCTAISKHVVPFAVLEPAIVVLPICPDGNGLEVCTATQLRAAGFREFAEWMDKVETIWKAARERKATRQTVYEWLDYQGKLHAQRLSDKHLVLYNAAGTNLSAVYLCRDSLPGQFIVDHMTYWAACVSPQEANYLVAILNSEVINEAIKPFQSMGLLGERHVHKKVLDLPIPDFVPAKPTHQALSALGKQAREAATVLVNSPDFPPNLARRRGWIREQLQGLLSQIDGLVRSLM